MQFNQVVPAGVADRWGAAEAEYVVSGSISADLPALATDALIEGWDSPSLRVLAGSQGTDPRDDRDLFLAASRELGRELPGRDVAARELLRFYLRAIQSGAIEPIIGARSIIAIGFEGVPDDVEWVVGYMSGLDDEWIGDWGRAREDVASAIRLEAGAYLEGDP